MAVADLAEAKEAGLAEGLRQLAAGEVDAVITTIAAPARALQRSGRDGAGSSCCSLGTQERAILAGAQPDLVPVTLPPNTYPGQTETVDTVAVTAILVGTAPSRTPRSRPCWARSMAASTSSAPAARPDP